MPVTVKFRMGIDDDHLTYLERRAASPRTRACAAVALHARTAEQLYSGTADWHADRASSRRRVTAIPVLGNGDIWEADRRAAR